MTLAWPRKNPHKCTASEVFMLFPNFVLIADTVLNVIVKYIEIYSRQNGLFMLWVYTMIHP